jgi:predicted dehydrogenase
VTSQRTIGVGVIGTGFARTTQLPGWRACEGARVVAVASGRRENAEAAAREFDIPFVADDWREVVGREADGDERRGDGADVRGGAGGGEAGAD